MASAATEVFATAPAAGGKGADALAGSAVPTAKDLLSEATADSAVAVEAADSGASSGKISLGELISIIDEELRAAFEEGGPGDVVQLSSRTRIADAMRDLDISDGCLDQYKHFESEKKYTRNLIATDGERFTLMLLCWNGGKESPVHDHPCRGCWMRVCEGSVTETRYARKDGSLVEVGAATFESPAVAYVHDSMGLHKVGAAMQCERACTLHLYAPPFSTCSIWLDPSCADKAMHPVVTYHSEYGELVDYTPASTGRTIADATPSASPAGSVAGEEEEEGDEVATADLD
mmetsp:Transcript_7766/g.30674  ORF Transcript_7766/g.30674 Transcript_7766/m.30674 type:complete len:290 (-) Transcript_7766:129-998(-)